MILDQLHQVDDRGSYEPADIASKIEALENRFDGLQTRIINEISAKPGITAKEVLSKLTGLPLSLRKEYESSIEKRIERMRKETQIDDLFIFHLKPLSSFMDFRLIEYFIKQYGSDGLKKDMVSYCGEMVVFMKETTIEQLRGHLPGEPEVPPAFSKLKAKIGEDASKYTLEQVNKFRKEYCGNLKLSEMVVHLFTFKKSNSFIVWWVVPSALVSDIMNSARTIDQSFYQEYKITSLTLDGMWLFLSESEIDAMWSKMCVGDTKFNDQFHIMHKQILCEIGGIGRSTATDKLSSYLIDQQQTLLKEVSVNISKAILSPNFPISLIDFRMPAIVIELFGSDCLKTVMESYCHFMSTFVKQSTLEQLIELPLVQSRVPENFLTAECKIKGEPFKYGLEKLFEFQTRFCSVSNIDTVCFVVGEVRKEVSGSFTVSWHIPSAAVYFILFTRNELQSLYQEYQITSLTLDGMWIQLSDAEIDAMWSRLHVSDAKFEGQFHTMYKQIVYELEMEQKTRHELSSHFKRSLKCHQSTSDWLSHELLSHKLPVSVIDFRVLAAAIEGFGSDCLKSVMSSYSKYILTFLKKPTAQQLINLSAVQLQPSGYSIVKCRIKKEPSHYKLEKFFSFRSNFCTIADFSEFCFIMDEVATFTENSGSFTVSWLVPPAFISDIMKSSRKIDQSYHETQYKITSLALDGMWLHMSDTEIDAMWSRLHVSDAKFEGQFHTMYKQIVYELEMEQKIRHELSSHFKRSLKCHQSTSDWLSHELLSHKLPVSVIDFRVLAAAIEGFGSDCLKSVMSSYSKYILTFLKKPTAQQLINLSAVQLQPSGYSIVKCRIKKKLSQYTLDELFNFRARFCSMIADLNEFCFVMDGVATEMGGSFTVSWLVPPAFISGIMKFTRYGFQSFHQEYNITSLTLDGMWLHMSDTEIDAMWSRLHVSDAKFEGQFHTMYKQIVYELEMEQKTRHELSSHFKRSLKCHQSTSDWLSHELLSHELPVSVIDFRVLAAAIEGFGSDCLKSVMSSYSKYILTFLKKPTAQQLINLSAVQLQPSGYSIVKCRIKKEPSHYKLEKLFSFRSNFCTIADFSEFCFIMDEVATFTENSGSFTVSWLVPPAFISDIMKSNRKIDQSYHETQYKITSLALDGMWLHMSDTEIDAMWSRLHVSDAKFEGQFHTMYKQIVYELEMEQKTRHELSSHFKRSLKCHQSTSDWLSHELLSHKLPVSVVDFRVLAAAIEGFGSDCLKCVMSSYSKHISTLLKEPTAQQLVQLSAIQLKPSGYSIVKCRIKKKLSQYTLDELFNFQARFCSMIADLNEFCFVMDGVATEMGGSFTVSWLVPPAFISGIMKFTRYGFQSFHQEYNITSLTLDGMWLHMSDTEINATWSWLHVSNTKFKDQFRTMCKQIVCEMKAKSVSKYHLLSYFQSLDYQQQISNQLSLAVLEGEFPASFVDFRILQAVIEKFGSDCLRRVMRSYCNYMSIISKESTAQQLVTIDNKIQYTDFKHLKITQCRIMEDPSNYRLETLFSFRTRFCTTTNLSEVCFIMSEINSEAEGSFIVSWLVPPAFISDIMKSIINLDQSFYQEYKITSLILDGMWIFLSDDEIDVMWSQVHPSNFESQFLTCMYRQIVCELKLQEISKNELSSYLMDQNPKLQSNASIQLSEAFLKHDFPLHFKLMSTVIDKFGSDCLKNVMKSFQNNVYTRESTVEQLASLPPIPSQTSKYFVSVESRNREDPSDCRLARLLNFQARFCNIVNIDEVCFIMDKIKAEILSGSFIVKWHVPSNLALELLKSANQLDLKQTELFQEMNIASLQLGGMWCYNYQLTPLGIQLKKRYQQSQGSPSPVEWIPSPTKKIFRLAMIQRERVQRGHIEDRFVRMTISGRVDDILHAKSPVELEDIFRNTLHGGEIILIEGAPGSGKSTLTVHICQRWGKGELFQQFTVVILVQLRDPAVQRAQTIADLLPVENAEEIAAELKATNGRGVLWVLDGWDELPPHLQKDSIFYQLVKRMLSECSVIVTSRPISSGDLHPVVSSRIEVLGFTPEEQMRYFTECFKRDTKALEALLEKIQENPVVQSIYYLPLNAAFIVHTFKYRGQSLPNTEYEIYLSVILSCIQRHYDREGRGHDLPRELASLDDLSRNEAVREPFQCLCELAYRGVTESKVAFSTSDLLQGASTLSLLQAIESFLQSGESVYYNFLHLSVQEILSAYYIATKLSDNEQVSQFQQLFNQPRFAAVFQFYAAITKLKSPGISQVIDTIVEAKSKPLLVSLLRCLHEAQDPALCLYVAERLEKRLDLSETSLSPVDCLSVSFFLSSVTGKEVSVNLSKCQIGDFGAKWLTKYLSVNSYTDPDLVTINLKGNDIHNKGASHVAKILYFIEHLHLNVSENPIGVAGASFILEALQTTTVLKSLTLVGYVVFSRKVEDILIVLGRNNSLMKVDMFWNNPESKEITQPTLDLIVCVDKDAKISAFTNLDKIVKDIPKLSLNLASCLSASENLITFITSWCIPSVPISYLMESANRIGQGYFEMKHILSLSVGNLWLYNPKLSQSASILKRRYQQSQDSPSPVEWISSPTKKIFRLAMIQRERVQRGHIEDRFVRMTISGRVDDILHAKSPVELEDIFRNTLHGGEIILIEGAPGSGKSTLAVHICQRWGKGELFQQFTVVILVQLRDPAVQRAQTIADLLPVENAEEIAAELLATNGCGVLWVLDGWDELPPHLQQESIFFQFIKRMLSKCSVIVTSRPISSADLHPVVSSRIEVLGFTPEEQKQYFTECLKGDTKALAALLEKIQENPVVQSICYLPLNAAFIVHTFKYRDQSLPNTEYEIYLSVILSCIQRHYDREGRGHDLPRELTSLDDLSRIEAVREPFQCLCELAYRGVMENKVTFSSSDLPQGSNTLSLLQAIESFLQSGKSVFYNFLHLSIQEVLSAYYMTTWLSDSEQVSQFQQLFNQPRFAAVFQFYAAITKLKSPGICKFIATIIEAKSKPLLVSLLRCLHEAQDPALCLYAAERLEYRLDLRGTSLSPLDCLSVSFFLSFLSGKKTSVHLDRCTIGDLGAKFLSKYLHADNDIDYVSKIIIDLADNDIHEEGALHISKMLFYLEHLYSYHNPIGDTGASLMSEAMRETVTLKTLILCHCDITSRGAEDLSRALAQNSSLKKLDIGDNDLGDEGISHMAEALKQNKQLKELWIGNCGMTDKGADFLTSALTVNNSLKMLHIGGRVGALTEDGLSAITHSLANKSLFVKLAIPAGFGCTATAEHLGRYIDITRKRNRLPPMEIEGEYTVLCG